MTMPWSGPASSSCSSRLETSRLSDRWPTESPRSSTCGDRVRVLAAVDAGAANYILKEADPEDLLRAVRAAARGESPVSPRAGQALFAARTGRLEAAEQLTSRERQVLLLVAEGLVNKQIARRLGITEKTTKAHLTRIYAAIGVSDRTQAALWAERHGLLQDDWTT